jgi:putative component of membrane protein insertase Oxa1/YidC/SpoIIIJ protein YidD
MCSTLKIMEYIIPCMKKCTVYFKDIISLYHVIYSCFLMQKSSFAPGCGYMTLRAVVELGPKSSRGQSLKKKANL